MQSTGTHPKLPLIDENDEALDLADLPVGALKPAHQVLDAQLAKRLGVRGPQKLPTKERITIRLSKDVLNFFRSSGDGWQTRVDQALHDWMKRHRI